MKKRISREKSIILTARIISMLFTPFYLPLVGLMALFINADDCIVAWPGGTHNLDDCRHHKLMSVLRYQPFPGNREMLFGGAGAKPFSGTGEQLPHRIQQLNNA